MPSIDQLFDSFTTAFRFEALPSYRVTETEEQSVYERYMDGQLHSCPADAGWAACIQKWKSENKNVQRVRMIPSKFSSYVNFELEWAYHYNIDAGECISVIQEYKVVSLANHIPPDFWVFDSKYVATFKYSNQGEWLGATVLEQGIDVYVELSKKLSQAATDFKSYLKIKRGTGIFQ